MSNRATGNVFEFSAAAGLPRLVLVCLADDANGDGWAWTRLDTLARKANMKPDAVQRSLAELEAMGEITGQPGDGENLLYYIEVAAPSATQHTEVKSAKAVCRVPADYRPTPAMMAQAAQTYPDINLDDQTLRFVDYWTAKNGKDAAKTMDGWHAAWRNWIRNADDWSKKGGNYGNRVDRRTATTVGSGTAQKGGNRPGNNRYPSASEFVARNRETVFTDAED